MSQCVMSIFEPFARTGSGSCISSTKLCVPGGACDHFNSGDTALGPAAIVYLSGMTPPSSHADVVMISGGTAGPRPPLAPRWPPPAGGVCGVWASADVTHAAVSAVTTRFLVMSASRNVRTVADATSIARRMTGESDRRRQVDPVSFRVCVGWEERLDAELLERDVLWRAERHDGAEDPDLEIILSDVNRQQHVGRMDRCCVLPDREITCVLPELRQ